MSISWEPRRFRSSLAQITGVEIGNPTPLACTGVTTDAEIMIQHRRVPNFVSPGAEIPRVYANEGNKDGELRRNRRIDEV
jgi:hypothetical protein